MRQTYGYAKKGAGRGYTGVKGLNALIGIVSTPSSFAGERGRPAAQGLDELECGLSLLPMFPHGPPVHLD